MTTEKIPGIPDSPQILDSSPLFLHYYCWKGRASPLRAVPQAWEPTAWGEVCLRALGTGSGIPVPRVLLGKREPILMVEAGE